MALKAQTEDSAWTVVGSDTINVRVIKDVNITAVMDEAGREEYKKLKRRVKKVMPFAKMAAYKMQVMEDNLSLKKGKKERKRYVKECEESLKQMYMDQLKNLSIEEGKVLMKLIYRETGKTTWQIMKSYRGGAEALMWQAFGTVYGHDMKVEYDPVIDYQIENIIRVEDLEWEMNSVFDFKNRPQYKRGTEKRTYCIYIEGNSGDAMMRNPVGQ